MKMTTTTAKNKKAENKQPDLKKHIEIEVQSNSYNLVYRPFFGDERRLQIFFGGSSSGKSYFIAQRAVLDLMDGRNYLVCRSVARTIRESCWNEVSKAIIRMGLRDYFRMGQSDLRITCLHNGSQMIFAGLDDVEKIKSITPAVGVITDIWMEEATEIARRDYKQLEKRLRGRAVHPKRMTLSFNPISKEHWIFKEFFGRWDDTKTLYEDEQMFILKTTYKDNRFLMPEDIYSLLHEKDEYYRDVYTLG